jgi:hypothetical protein
MDINDYQTQPVAEPGIYRAWPIAWTIETADSGAVAIATRFAILQQWHADHKAWSAEWPVGYYSDARTYVVKKDGQPNASAIESLAKAGLWNGDFDALAFPPPQVYVHITVEEEEYQGKRRARVNWINPNAEEPAARGGFTPANQDLLKSLRARFGGPIRAIAGGQPTGAPPAPPQTAPAAVQQPAAPWGQPAAQAAPAAHAGGYAQAQPAQAQPARQAPPTSQFSPPATTARPAGPPPMTNPAPKHVPVRPPQQQREPGEDDGGEGHVSPPF